MVILRSQNKITDFFMILALASPFNPWSAEIFLYKLKTKGFFQFVFFCLSCLFLLHLNTYRRQILPSKVDPLAVMVNLGDFVAKGVARAVINRSVVTQRSFNIGSMCLQRGHRPVVQCITIDVRVC